MSRVRKVLERVLNAQADAAIRFLSLRSLMKALGFEERIRGDHYIYTREGVTEIVNLQPQGALAKPYQVKQVRQIIVKYRLGGEL